MREQGPIIVPLDGSELAEASLPYAAALAEALHTHLVLVTVWEGTESELGATFPAMAMDIEKSATNYFSLYLDGIRARYSPADHARDLVRMGDATEQILKAIEETGARMAVIATHGRSGIGRWIYGSTAGRLMRSSPVPIIAVGPNVPARSDKTAVKHVMVPLDGSPLSEKALPVAAALASSLAAKVSLVRGVRWAVQAYPYSLPDAYIPQIDDELEAGAKAYLRRIEGEVKAANAGIDLDAFVVRGAVADGLMDVVEKQSVDLVVMTTHARAGIARAALGSTADRMLQGKAPVLLVPPDGEAAKP
jgi:nucleotide-binding universal stress UspA family protein